MLRRQARIDGASEASNKFHDSASPPRFSFTKIYRVVILFISLFLLNEVFSVSERLRLVPLGSKSPHGAISMSPVKRHGFVEKLGAVPIERWHPSLETERRKSIREAVRSGELMIDGLPTMPPVSKCQIFVNHDYKFFYLRHPKSASTSIMNLFGVCDPADDRGPNVSNRTSCMRLYNKEEIDINDTTAYSALWKEYLVFTAVRNPFSRLLSTHRFELHLVKDTCEDLKEMISWDNFCADPHRLGLLCSRNPKCCVVPPDFLWHHLIDQSRCMTDEAGNMATDFIARVEHLDDDIAEFVKEVDARLPVGTPLSPLANVIGRGKRLNSRLTKDCVESPGGGTEPARFIFPEDRSKDIEYNAPLPTPRHCTSAQYFSDQHPMCAKAAMSLYRDDLKLFYDE